MTRVQKPGKGEQPPSAAKQKRDEEAFFARLRSALHTAGMRQGDLARKLGCNPSTITEWFGRGSMPKGHLMLYLPKALGVSPTWLLTGEGTLTEQVTSQEAHLRSAYQALAMVEVSLDKVRQEIAASSPVHKDAASVADSV